MGHSMPWTSPRSHDHSLSQPRQPIGMGVDPKRVMAELFGGDRNFAGSWGSMHIFRNTAFMAMRNYPVKFLWVLEWHLEINTTKRRVTLCYMGDEQFVRGHSTKHLISPCSGNFSCIYRREQRLRNGTSVERTANHADIGNWALAMKCHVDPLTEWIP